MSVVSFSQAGQDLFPRYVCKSQEGRALTYLEIGSQDPVKNNNTYALEQEGWVGVSLDIEDFIHRFQSTRRNPFVWGDATKVNWATFFDHPDILKAYQAQETQLDHIDYLSFDVDDASEPTFERFPWETVRFSAITLEHDAYRVGGSFREKTRTKLLNLGYQLVCADVVHPGLGPFEDWYIDPNPLQIHMDRVGCIRCNDTPYPFISTWMSNRPQS